MFMGEVIGQCDWDRGNASGYIEADHHQRDQTKCHMS